MDEPSSDVNTTPLSVPSATGGVFNNKNNNMIIVAIIVAVIIIFFIYKSKLFQVENYKGIDNFKMDNIENLDDVDPLTKCGWEVYVSPTCPYCVRQKSILSKHFPTFKNIFTDKPTDVVPTWYNVKTKQKIPGMQSYEKLLEMTKC
jgi:hypothetical protein